MDLTGLYLRRICTATEQVCVYSSMKDSWIGKVQVGCSRRIIAAFVAQGELQLAIKADDITLMVIQRVPDNK